MIQGEIDLLKGISASSGVAIGKVLILQEETVDIEKDVNGDIEDELERWVQAIEASKKQLQQIQMKVQEEIDREHAQIFEAHLLILEDPAFVDEVKNKINSEHISAEFALMETTKHFIQIFESMENEYMRERAADIEDVSTRILHNLKGIEDVNLSSLEEEAIIVAYDLTPSHTAQMDKKNVIGLITEIGGKTSHTAIMARSLEIPAVVGLKDIVNQVKNGDIIGIDGEEGIVHHPLEDDVKQNLLKKKQVYENQRKELLLLKDAPSATKDQKRIELAGNIGTPQDVEKVLQNGGEGIGLFRTEFLYMNRDSLPTEEEQFQAYKQVLSDMEGKPVVIRTLDIGGDKALPYLDLPKELNPFLGYRAIRICLDQVDIFKTQLRALLRASRFGNLKIMLPMISAINELHETKKIYEEVKLELDQEDKVYSQNIEVGIMIETPSAAIISDLLAKEVDFFSIGTNDLIQYTIAVDRMNEKISHLYDPFHPAILRLIQMVIENGHKEGIWVGMCGEVAGDPKLIPLLIGMGIDELSMSPSSILPARKLIGHISTKRMKDEVQELLKYNNKHIKSYCENLLKKIIGDEIQ